MIALTSSSSSAGQEAGAASIAMPRRPVPSPQSPAERREEAATALERLFFTMMVKELRKTLPEGLFGETAGAGIYEGLFDQAMADAVTAGPGSALRELILAHLPEGVDPKDLEERADASMDRIVAMSDTAAAAIQDTSILSLGAENGASLALARRLRAEGNEL